MSGIGTLLVVGPTTHGVTRLALELAETPALAPMPVVRVQDGIEADLVAAVTRADPGGHEGPGGPGGVVHLHVTDRLLGRSAPHAADALVALASRARLCVTLHDLPQPSDGPGGHERRAAAYARVVEAVAGVVVSSEHERALLDDALRHAGRADLVGARPVEVIPLPIEPPAASTPREPGRPRDLVLLGFLYPGKGHHEALAALADLPDDVGLLALGRPSDGHEDLVEDLRRRAEQMGRRFTVSGYVPDEDLADALRAAAVPVAPHRHLSASGSIGSWLSAGRRPLVPRSRYVDELEERCPGALLRYDGDDLAAACAGALTDPASTWLAPDVLVGPSRDEVGRRYREVLDGWAR